MARLAWVLGSLFLAALLVGALGVGAALRPDAVANAMVPVVAPVIPPPQAVFGKDRLHVLVLGRDYDYTANDVEYSSQSRSDVIMAFTLDFASHRITELSVPRDTAVTMPDGSRQKINGALSSGGVPQARKTIGRFLGVSFDRYALLRIDSTKQLIDAVGGIDVPVHETLDYDDSWGHLHVHVTPGMRHMNGAQAVAYGRFRHDACGDPCRISRQQDVLHAIGAKLRNDRANDLMHAQALISVIAKNVSTDLSTPELLSLAWAFRDLDPKRIEMAQVPSSGDELLPDGGDALVPDEDGKRRLVRRLMLAPAQTR